MLGAPPSMSLYDGNSDETGTLRQSPTILIADGSSFFRRNLAMILQSEGYNILFASTGADVIATCVKHLPDLVLMDIGLPDISGLEVCSILKRSEQLSDIFVLLMAAREREDIIHESFERGARSCLFKPLESLQLLDIINSLLSPMPKTGMPVHLIFEETGQSFRTHAVSVQKRAISIMPTQDILNAGEALTTGARVRLEYQSEDKGNIACTAELKAVRLDALQFGIIGNLKRNQKRRFFRKGIDLKARYLLPGQFFRLARTVDLSGGGCRLADVGGQLEEGMEFILSIFLTATFRLDLSAKVEWFRAQGDGKCEVGCSFVDIHPEVQSEIVMFLFDENWASGVASVAM